MLEALPESKVRRCVFNACKEDSLAQCHKCGRYYCLDHGSELDVMNYCVDCLHVEDALLEKAPLVDTEGIRHHGKVIRPVGLVFHQNGKLIHEMTDDELKASIVEYQQAVHDCERSLDYARIKLGNAMFEAGGREIAKVNERGEVYFPPPRKAPVVMKDRRKVKAPIDENALADFLLKTLSPEQLAKFIANRSKKE